MVATRDENEPQRAEAAMAAFRRVWDDLNGELDKVRDAV